MNTERRNDIGTKAALGGLMAVISIMLAIFFTGTYTKADEACTRSFKNEKDIAVAVNTLDSIDKQMSLFNIKQDRISEKIDKLLSH